MRLPGLALLFAASVSSAAAATVEDHSFKDADGMRVLSETIVVHAARADVWKAFTTDAGFAKWGAPVVHIVPGTVERWNSRWATKARSAIR